MGLFTVRNDEYYLNKIVKYYENEEMRWKVSVTSKKLNDPNAQFKSQKKEVTGFTQLHLAANYGDIKSVERLIEEGVRLEIEGTVPPIEVALKKGHTEIVKNLFYATSPDVNELLRIARPLKNQAIISFLERKLTAINSKSIEEPDLVEEVNEITQLKHRLDEALKSSSSKSAEINSLNKRLVSNSNEFSQLKKKYNVIAKRENQIKAENENLERSLGVFKKHLETERKKVETLKNDKVVLNQKISNLNGRIKTQNEKLSKQQIYTQIVPISKQNDDVAELKRKLVEATQLVTNHLYTIGQLSKEITNQKQELDEQKKTILQKEKELNWSKKENNEKELQVANLSKNFFDPNNEIKDLKKTHLNGNGRNQVDVNTNTKDANPINDNDGSKANPSNIVNNAKEILAKNLQTDKFEECLNKLTSESSKKSINSLFCDWLVEKIERTTKECTICTEVLYDNPESSFKSIQKLSCRHEFHRKCVNKWFKVKRNCPICRAGPAGAQERRSSNHGANQLPDNYLRAMNIPFF